MASAEIDTVSLALESPYGFISATTKLPAVGSATWYAMNCKRASWLEGIEESASPRDLVRTSGYAHADQPISIINRSGGPLWGAEDGEMVQRYGAAPIVLDFLLEGIGDGANYATYDLLPMMLLALTSCARTTPSEATDTVASAGDVNSFTATHAARFEVGRPIAFVINGAVEHADVTGKSGSVVTYHPATSAALQVGDVVRLAYTLYPVFGTSPTSAALRFNCNGRQYFAFGCRVSQIDLAEENGQMAAKFTVQPAVILRSDSGATLGDWLEPGGHAVQMLGSYHVLSDSLAGVSAPAAEARNALSLHGWEASLRFALAATGGGRDNILGRGNTEITDFSAEVTLRGEPSATLEAMRRKKEHRTLVLGCGPTGAGSGLDAQGMALIIGAANASKSATFGKVEGRHHLTTTLRTGKFSGDNATDHAANTPWRWVWPL